MSVWRAYSGKVQGELSGPPLNHRSAMTAPGHRDCGVEATDECVPGELALCLLALRSGAVNEGERLGVARLVPSPVIAGLDAGAEVFGAVDGVVGGATGPVGTLRVLVEDGRLLTGVVGGGEAGPVGALWVRGEEGRVPELGAGVWAGDDGFVGTSVAAVGAVLTVMAGDVFVGVFKMPTT